MRPALAMEVQSQASGVGTLGWPSERRPTLFRVVLCFVLFVYDSE